MNKQVKFLYRMLTILLCLTVPLVLLMLITSFSPLLWGIRSYIVLTGSMEPTLPQGSIVFTHPSSSYTTDDIITFHKETTIITHRLYEIQSQNNHLLYITKGDANNIPDPKPVALQSIMGKEIFVLPFIGTAILFLKTPTGFILFIILPGIILITSEIRAIKKEWEKETEKKLLKKLKTI